MRVHDPLDRLLSTVGKVRVLRVLLRHPNRAWTGRELAGASGVSAPQTISSLRVLEEVGLVQRRVIGRAHEWQLVEENVLVRPLERLYSFERDLPVRLEQELAKSLKELGVRRAVLYGSTARGEETDQSDIDVYIEVGSDQDREAVERSLTPLFLEFHQRYGLSLSPYVLTHQERAKPRNPALIRSVTREGHVLVES
jgi:predicted nucleotidyltransferase